MAFLVAAVVLVGLVCLVDLLLTFGVIRRLREHTTTLEKLLRTAATADPLAFALPQPGAVLTKAALTTTDGEPVAFTRETGVAFFTSDCTECLIQLPDFVAWAGGQPREQVLAVLAGGGPHTDELVAGLSGVARIVVEKDVGTLSATFGVSAFPSYCVVGADGRIVLGEVEPRRLRAVA
ncbi:TlpA family protein disulfide reductase [Nonomuraea sp. NPDC050556]|uniref:TlpA family protein disulfide reductase n=1 Tax=Nonomuraea sp. NPDC050556 TaxID=3364369 RepID=UPI0037BAA6D5